MGLYEETLGTLLIGIFFNTFLYGLVTYQFAVYCQTKFDDRPATKYMVLFLFLLDTFHSASAIYMAWYYTVTNFDNPTALWMGEWVYPFTPLGTALTAFVTQMYLGIRIWRFTKSKILYGAIILLAIPALILGVLCSILAWLGFVIPLLFLITPIAIAWLIMQVVVDTFITVVLIIIFSRSRTGFRRSGTVLNRLIRGAVQTGLFAGIFSLANLFCYVFFPNTNLDGLFGIPLGRIYTNTLMDGLLARESLNAVLSPPFDPSEALGGIDWDAVGSSQTTSNAQPTSNQLQVEVERTVEETSDRSTREDGERKNRSIGGLR